VGDLADIAGTPGAVPASTASGGNQMSRPTVLPAAAPATDTELVERARAGDAGAMEALMRRHNRILYRTARAILGERLPTGLAGGMALVALGFALITRRARGQFPVP
jgi:hypothetical protein